ncbi:winged helix-turn-helix domain-containing protein [Metallosphaera tengchongensis]|uniref:Winged helix-turn-helix domain-containing protein n=1 Tax=Metallosphaera tengchongensis TaxID=1532350 RepID=A0A6N0NRL4_9CREN|nr:DUF4443 domain-containing protein [Metallosphaera tengchongensis]QKQ99351.1 winged helix-turn-helix domain-containing protein [Metallosphaera tengchongensis]
MSELSALEETTRARQGNKPSYDEAYVLWALNLIYDEPPMGRLTLMKRLTLSEASVKTMLRRLRESNLVSVDRVGGAELTLKGKRLVEEWRSRVSIFSATLSSIGWESIQIALKNGGELIEKVGIIQLRDDIIKIGADAVLITVKTQEDIEIPPKTEEFAIKSLLEELSNLSSQYSSGDLIIYIKPSDLHLAYKVGIFLLQKLQRN